tara:strand:+ start:447 stop:563 length:117 start_codon:yes stop_codon:yes gene_type:complete
MVMQYLDISYNSFKKKVGGGRGKMKKPQTPLVPTYLRI